MSKSLKKRSHWTGRVHEVVLGRSAERDLGFELKGGAENGQFPFVGELKPPPGRAQCHSGKLSQDELLLEVNDTPVAGLTTRDVLAVVRHCKEPLRLKCVKQGEERSACVRPPALGRERVAERVLLLRAHSFPPPFLPTCGL
ncbi:Membrane-associated guanylate kinase, WW and PDZ domain-containing protein 2-like [Scleropages formosus]|uniref:Membrane-associated guanylate kinase, WW and PDZ domain-containing protein 2-like n=1 Tax=Scleropages formosus TaxID=113540 RepID=A0A0P7U2B1_SCLFO|nr:Membrane-associated guanylate kinase, WW and PDZ domain-containing protein 2-like [Scleropages formosus]